MKHTIVILLAISLVHCTGKDAPDQVEKSTAAEKPGAPEKAAAAEPEAAPEKGSAKGEELVLISAGELAALEGKLMERVKANQVAKCPRPVLRGDATAGPADDDIHQLLGPGNAAVMECLTYIEKNPDIDAYLESPVESLADTIAKAQKVCAPVAPLLSAAVQHEDSCSPYLAGRKGHPHLIRLIRLSKAVALLMERLSLLGHPAKAVELGLDLLVLSQDVSRGGASLICAMVGVATSQIITLRGIRTVLNATDHLPAAQLASLMAQMDRLIAAEPTFGSFWDYERVGFALMSILPGIKPEGWEPPGGWDEGTTWDPAAAALGESIEGVSNQQQYGLVLLAADRSFRLLSSACPQGTAPIPCHEALEKAGRENANKATDEKFARTFKTLLSQQPTEEIRAWILDILSAVATPAFNKYVVRYANRMQNYVAVRSHLAILAFRLEQGRCPAEGDFKTDSGLSAALLEPWSKDRMTVTTKDGGRITLSAPAAYANFKDDRGEQEYLIQCNP